ncbi:MAG: carboxymuconolactone decarboxylase family protein [Novosphingobium sp.]|nr:carboxymuconolactone decarboxylase family protein [Novosphingobium sp.]MCP5403046.1 carboxymuconolactone decarboxylase family protein [Novosphingobium sp.]
MPRIEPIPWENLTPEQREAMQAGLDSGAYTDPLPLQIMAYADHDTVPDDGDRHPNFPRHLLDGKLLELLRIRSAQLGGCEPCMASRKVDGATEDLVACMADPSLSGDLTPREKLALEYINLMGTDHHRIDGEMYRRLAEHFTLAEIVELGLTCSHMIGTHRFMHTLDIYGDAEPVLHYDPGQVGVTWKQANSEPTSTE